MYLDYVKKKKKLSFIVSVMLTCNLWMHICFYFVNIVHLPPKCKADGWGLQGEPSSRVPVSVERCTHWSTMTAASPTLLWGPLEQAARSGDPAWVPKWSPSSLEEAEAHRSSARRVSTVLSTSHMRVVLEMPGLRSSYQNRRQDCACIQFSLFCAWKICWMHGPNFSSVQLTEEGIVC